MDIFWSKLLHLHIYCNTGCFKYFLYLMVSVKVSVSYVFRYLTCKIRHFFLPSHINLSKLRGFSLLKYLQLINCIDSMLFDNGFIWSAI